MRHIYIFINELNSVCILVTSKNTNSIEELLDLPEYKSLLIEQGIKETELVSFLSSLSNIIETGDVVLRDGKPIFFIKEA